MTLSKMVISSLMESISKLWPFSQVLEMSDEGYFVNPQMSSSDSDFDTEDHDGEGTDTIDVALAHGTTTVSRATFGAYVPGSCLTVCLSRLRSNHSSQQDGFLACQDNTILLPLRDTRVKSSMMTSMTTSQAETRRSLQSVRSHTEAPASTKCPVTMSPVRSR